MSTIGRVRHALHLEGDRHSHTVQPEGTSGDGYAGTVEKAETTRPHHGARHWAKVGLAGLALTCAVTPVVGYAVAPGMIDSGIQQIGTVLQNQTVVPSQYITIDGVQTPYETLSSQQIGGAMQRGAGETTPVQYTTGNQDGTQLQEPISLVYTGPLNTLQKMLQGQGWHAPYYPTSDMYVNGQKQVLTLSKNENIARDHLRVFDMGKSSQGQQRWGIAATRDVTGTMTTPGDGKGIGFGHLIDNHIDNERNMVMHDLLAANPGLNNTFRAVLGTGASSSVPYISNYYVFEF